MLTLLLRLTPRIVLAAPVAVVGTVIAETASDPSAVTIDWILKAVPGGFVLALILLDKLDTTGERNLLRTQLAESQARERALYASIKDDLTPALLESNRLVAENTRVFGEVVKPLLERVARAMEERR